jgi:dihydroorotase
LAKETGARLHIMHISTAKELELLANKPIEEKNITAEACVSHLFFCDEDYETFGTRIKCNPAIKSKADRDALRQALTNNLIDVIGTDHAPHLLSEKQGGALKAVSGMPTLQFSLTAVMELVHEGLLSIEQLVQKMCHAPATLYQIEKRGFIRTGYKADLALIDPACTWKVDNECLLSKCGWSPMEGETFHSKVKKTFVNGHLVYNDNQVDTLHRGQELRFER